MNQVEIDHMVKQIEDQIFYMNNAHAKLIQQMRRSINKLKELIQ